MDKNTEKILMKLPDEVKSRLLRLPERFISDFEEIRVKSRCSTMVISCGREMSLNDAEYMTPELLEEILNRLLNYSYYAYEEELSKGYITIEGGHRVGVCGRVVLNNGRVHTIKDISSMNIRRSRPDNRLCRKDHGLRCRHEQPQDIQYANHLSSQVRQDYTAERYSQKP